jgi:two-component system, sensor histidine kinase PdtaS
MADPQRSRTFLRTLVSFGRSLENHQDLAALLQRAVVLAARALELGHAKIMRYRPDHGDLFIEAGIGWKPGLVGLMGIGIDSASPAGRALQTNLPITVEDLPHDATFRYPDSLREHGIVSTANIPIHFDGETWGVLEVDSTQPRSFGEDEIEFLFAMSHLLVRPIRREQMDQLLRQASEEKARIIADHDLVLREIDHRMKNNLQVIQSFLAMEQRRLTDDAAREAFQNAMDRVTAVALAHDQLSTRQRGEEIDLGTYFAALCTSLEKEHEGRITISTHLEGVQVSMTRAVPLGLIVNEAVTNAAKYAYREPGGPVEVRLNNDLQLQEGVLEVRDQGGGIKETHKGGSGLRLMNALARQTGGSVERTSSENGTTIRVVFPRTG